MAKSVLSFWLVASAVYGMYVQAHLELLELEERVSQISTAPSQEATAVLLAAAALASQRARQ